MASSIPSAVDSKQLCALLDGILHTNNSIRQQAEEAFNTLKRSNPTGLVLGLLRELSQNTQVHVRQQSSVSLRTLLLETSASHGDVWLVLSSEAQQAVQRELFFAIHQEPTKQLRRAICDVIVAVATRSDVEWNDLSMEIFNLIQNTDPLSQLAGLRLSSELLSDIKGDVEDFRPLISRSAKSSDPDIRLECLDLVASILQYKPRHKSRLIQDTTPDFVAGVLALLETESNELATGFLVKLVEIADLDASFFKPHLRQLVQMALSIAQAKTIEDETRQMATELLLTLAEHQPQMCLKLPNFVADVIGLLLNLMLTVEDDGAWLDQEDDTDEEETRNYDVGEAGLDRVAAALGGENVMRIVFNHVSQYLQRPEWQYRLVGVMAIAQTAEYLTEDDIDAHMDSIMSALLTQLKDQHHRVRFAACQALGQIALDLLPFVQKTYANNVVPELAATLDDQSTRVQAHAAAALVNFAEEVDKADLLPYADDLMNKLFSRTGPNMPRGLREQSVTCIAVIAGVLENSFLKYYPVVVPAIMDMLKNATDTQERTLRAKAAECASIIGLAVGCEVFEKDAQEIMSVLLQLVSSEQLDADNPIRDYIHETVCRICRTLKEKFLVYLPHLMPGVLKVLQVSPEQLDSDDLLQDMTLSSVADTKVSGLKTSITQEITQALEMISAFVEILGPNFGEFLAPTAEAVLPLLNVRLNDDVKRAALTAMAEFFSAMRSLQQLPSTDPSSAANCESLLKKWLTQVLEKIFDDLSAEEEDVPDIDLMVAETGGLSKCLRNAGRDVLTPPQVAAICKKVFELMQDSSNRRAAIATKKSDPVNDEDDLERLEDEESSEQTLRSTLLEIISALMALHSETFLQTGATLSEKFIETYLHPSCSADDRALALYVADDILEHLKDLGSPLWPSFANRLVESLSDEAPTVRQAAAFGMIQAAKCREFPKELIQQAATSLVGVLRNPKSREKSQLSATDNAIAALGSIVLNRGADLQPSLQEYLDLWINNLPLKVDDEEARRVHGDLLNLLLKQNPNVLGPNNANLPKLASICAAIYRTEFSSTEIDKAIRVFVQAAGFDVIQSIGVNFGQKLQKGLEKIHRDVIAAKD